MKYLLLMVVACQAAKRAPEPFVLGPLGGSGTVANASQSAFGQVAANVSRERGRRFFLGNAHFKRTWVTAPASAEAVDGLGPLFNASSCSICHVFDGRGRPPEDDDIRLSSMLMRVGPHPVYGTQLQHRAVLSVPPEGQWRVRYSAVTGSYDDGEPYALQQPMYEFYDMRYGPADFAFSPRVGNQLIGLGLLEAVSDADILSREDPDDADGDGISGRANRKDGTLGRFGWKASEPTVESQVAGALVNDMGITSTLAAEQPCMAPQAECVASASGGTPEIGDMMLGDMVFYSRTLAVPMQRPYTGEGLELFVSAGCAACHTHTLRTADVAAEPELAGQTIHPFTDLLLHDMGEELADHRPDQLADGREWRTPPLWGVGLIPVVNGHHLLLHDGRARGVAEAILWHGGEAAAARAAFKAMSKAERDALVAFVESL